MKLTSLSENQHISLSGEDLEIECDVPKGVAISVVDGDISICGKVMDNVRITAKRTPVINIVQTEGRLIADYAVIDEDGHVTLSDNKIVEGTIIRGSTAIVGGKVFELPLVTFAPSLKGNVTLMRDMSDSSEIIADGEVFVNKKRMVVETCRNYTDKPSLHILITILLFQNYSDNLFLFKKCIQCYGCNFQIEGNTLLMLAAQNGKLSYLKALIEAGANINTESDDQETALSLAFDNGYNECAKFLIESGAEVNSKNFYSLTEKEGSIEDLLTPQFDLEKTMLIQYSPKIQYDLSEKHGKKGLELKKEHF